MYNSFATLNTLNYLKDAGIIKFDLFLKRTTLTSYSNPYNRKYIALIKKC